MSWLYIDTRQKDQTEIAWLSEGGEIKRRNIEGRAKAVLTAIEKDWDAKAGTLEGIVIASGPGSFSSVRTGVLYANLFARFLGLPMYEIIGAGAISLEDTLKKVQTGQLSTKQYVEPIYDREPHITQPKA